MKTAVLSTLLAALAPAVIAQSDTSSYLLTFNASKSSVDSTNTGTTSTVSYANSSIYIGGINVQTEAEPLILVGSDDFLFTSYHQVPTGGQNIYLFPDATKPVGFTVPHGHAVPQGAVSTGFSYNADNYNQLLFKGENKFIGCQNEELKQLQAYQIYWKGAGNPTDKSLTCVSPIVLQKSTGGCGASG